jgi:hypothetical protein
MYFFLFNLSLADIGFITTVPKMLVNIHTHSKSRLPNSGVLFYSFWVFGQSTADCDGL